MTAAWSCTSLLSQTSLGKQRRMTSVLQWDQQDQDGVLTQVCADGAEAAVREAAGQGVAAGSLCGESSQRFQLPADMDGC